MLDGEPLTVAALIKRFLPKISLTWFLTLCETALLALAPLFIGFAIDGLIAGETSQLLWLSALFAGLIVMSVARRLYDTRAYGDIRVTLGSALIDRSAHVPLSGQNARLGMARELVDFLEEHVPALMTSSVQLVVSLVVLYFFHPMLAFAALGGAVVMIVIYAVFHKRFFRLSAEHNQQVEKQVDILGVKSPGALLTHLRIIRRVEVRHSDTEAYVYGTIFAVLVGFIIFNLWFSATHLAITAGVIFAIISYSWEFVESSLVLPATLQEWSRLSEIMQRINAPE